MMLFELVWLALILGGLLAGLGLQLSWREWFQLVRAWAPLEEDRLVWQRARVFIPLTIPGSRFMLPGLGTRAGPLAALLE
jgi:hypothetical protein